MRPPGVESHPTNFELRFSPKSSPDNVHKDQENGSRPSHQLHSWLSDSQPSNPSSVKFPVGMCLRTRMNHWMLRVYASTRQTTLSTSTASSTVTFVRNRDVQNGHRSLRSNPTPDSKDIQFEASSPITLILQLVIPPPSNIRLWTLQAKTQRNHTLTSGCRCFSTNPVQPNPDTIRNPARLHPLHRRALRLPQTP